MGEPLSNYDNTVKAIKILTSDFGAGISNRRITVSTCGLVPQILQLGKDICINLAVSLNAHDDETRSRLMPVNKKYPLAKFLDACKKYPMPGRRLLTFEYILIDGVNSSRADADKLARLLADQRCKLNLIVFNEYPGSPFKSPSPEDVSAFQQILLGRHFTAMLRKKQGKRHPRRLRTTERRITGLNSYFKNSKSCLGNRIVLLHFFYGDKGMLSSAAELKKLEAIFSNKVFRIFKGQDHKEISDASARNIPFPNVSRQPDITQHDTPRESGAPSSELLSRRNACSILNRKESCL